MIEFNPQRAFLNHNVLKNAVFSRLTDSPDLISSRRLEPDERIKGLAKHLINAKTLTPNMAYARDCWRREPETGQSVPDLIRDFVRLMRNLDTYEPTERFPSDAAFEKWLATIDAVMDDLDTLFRQDKPERESRARSLWDAALSLHDMLHSLNPHTPSFWEFMRNKNI